MKEILDGLIANRQAGAQQAEADEAASLDRLVSTLCRRVALRHPCANAGNGKVLTLAKRPCYHRNHRRDVLYAQYLCTELGLTGNVARGSDYVAPSAFHSVTRSEVRSWE